jgi:hypothetical protein
VDRRIVSGEAARGFRKKEQLMADKSPRQHLSKKAGKSIKEKRAEKQAKAAQTKAGIVPPTRKS